MPTLDKIYIIQDKIKKEAINKKLLDNKRKLLLMKQEETKQKYIDSVLETIDKNIIK